MAVRRVQIDGERTRDQGELASRYETRQRRYTDSGRSGMTRICEGCKEPEHGCEKMGNVWICPACKAKIVAKAKAMKTDASQSHRAQGEINHMMKQRELLKPFQEAPHVEE